MDIKLIVRGGVCEVEENNTSTKVIIIDWDNDEKGIEINDHQDSVIVEGSGGVFDIIHKPDNLEVELIDYDNL